MTEQPLLKLTNVEASYGSIRVLKGINIEVPRGQIVALLGANGAGKTTTLRAITGLVKVTGGSIELEGESITRLPTEQVISRGVATSPEGRQVFAELTVLENLKIGAFALRDRSLVKKNLARVYAFFPVLKERHKQIAGTLSGGEQQMLSMGRALMASPRVLLLDEPSLGLAPLIVRDIFQIIKDLNSEGATILIVEQNALQTLKVAHYAYILEVGYLILQGTGRELLNNPSVKAAYLGGHIH
ncbi:MAG: Branched-chain amino acid ABC transporter ATPase [Bacillota bacterium]|nr:MAG: Branched-chain amino acid ABC transporter ATPase [Bacillota bacterium]